MGVFTSGLIAVRPIKLKTSFTLDELAERAREGRYPEYADKRSEGWGSSEDDDAALNVPVVSRFTVGEPQFAQEVAVGEDGETVPRRLRMRYYWDRFDQRMRRTLGDSAPWDRLHVRQGVDAVIFDDETDSGRSVLLSARERSLLTSAPFPRCATWEVMLPQSSRRRLRKGSTRTSSRGFCGGCRVILSSGSM